MHKIYTMVDQVPIGTRQCTQTFSNVVMKISQRRNEISQRCNEISQHRNEISQHRNEIS